MFNVPPVDEDYVNGQFKGGLKLLKAEKQSTHFEKKINTQKPKSSNFKVDMKNITRILTGQTNSSNLNLKKNLTNQKLTESFPKFLIEEPSIKHSNNNVNNFQYRTHQKRSVETVNNNIQAVPRNISDEIDKANSSSSGFITFGVVIFGIIFFSVLVGVIAFGIIKIRNRKKMDKKRKSKGKSSRRNGKKAPSKNQPKSRSKKGASKSRSKGKSKSRKKSRSRKSKNGKSTTNQKDRTSYIKDNTKVNDMVYPNGIQQQNIPQLPVDNNISMNKSNYLPGSPIDSSILMNKNSYLQGNVPGYQGTLQQQLPKGPQGVVYNKSDYMNVQTPVIQSSNYPPAQLPNIPYVTKPFNHPTQNQLDNNNNNNNNNNKNDQNTHTCVCHYGMTFDQIIYVSYGEDNWQKAKENDTLSCFSFQIPSNYSINNVTM
uniref:SH3 domain-containing protein n=1 Tax=Strongyloides stercoralis TaxID=6248 RepID=A0A0K0E6I3_STRER